jgi:hypothetical protein
VTENNISLYEERSACVIAIARGARAMGCKIGFREDPAIAEPHLWPVLFIDLPSGQISWHLSREDRRMAPDIGTYHGVWDGHDTELKYRRLAAWMPLPLG